MPRGIENSKLRRGLIGGLVILPLVVAAAGCSSSKKDSGSAASGSGSGSSADSILGTPNKATGSPIVIGVNNPGKSASIDVTIEDTAIKALVSYANDYMGGINGHVIQLKVCQTTDAPAGQLDCANQAIQAKVSAVIQASGDDNTIKTVAAAGIPVFEGLAASTIGLSTPGVFSVGNALATFGSPAAYAKEIGAKNSALVVIDVPAASGPAKALAP
ncbi:MAG: branched-chain amino acid transporter substrate-binding protein, partial [Pseudonocardiales bacterium]|nr:branched-chain amino acid transporter substrate-binding protein [Pseudonocardiales bacterium]